MKKLAILGFILSFSSAAAAQELTSNLSSVSTEYSRLYVAPLVDAYGANINAGLFHTARVGGGLIPKVDLYLGVKVFGALLPADRSFSLSYEADQVFVGPDGTRYVVPVAFDIDGAPTVFGETETGEVVAAVNETIDAGLDGQMGTADDIVINETVSLPLLPGLINTPVAPLLVPHAQIGSVRGTDLMIRYLPTLSTDTYGKISFRGFGLRHSISQYIPMFPASLSAQVVYQRLSIEDASENQTVLASAYAANVAISKSLAVVTVYGGLQLEKTRVEVDYAYDTGIPELGVQEIQFIDTADNRFRAIAGITFTPGPLQMNVDYAVGATRTVSAGIGISL
ncbi:MAG: DUF6588 family protein [Rhodothermales bacterium]|nr:DUF6588 family protein [Rhodothermales bacterium]